MNLVELKELEKTLRMESCQLDKSVSELVKTWVENISGIKVITSRGSLRPCSHYRLRGTSKVALEYLDIKLANDKGEEVFGADLTLSWYGEVITVNTGSCGEFVVLGEQKEHDKYQVLKYKLLGLIMQYADELNKLLNEVDYSIITKYYDIRTKVSQLEWEEKQHQAAVERKAIIDSIKVGNVYFDHGQANTKTITKITDKRVYFKITYNSGYTITDKYYSKEDVIYNLKHNVYEEIKSL